MSDNEEKFIHIDKYTEEAQVWWDAWRIADPGAANPVAVARTLFKASAFLLPKIGAHGVKKHPALRVIAGQLATLYDVDSVGPSEEDLDKTQHEYTQQKPSKDGRTDICPLCLSYGESPCKERPSGGPLLIDHAGRPHTMDRNYGATDA
jgi:hypothetical protein